MIIFLIVTPPPLIKGANIVILKNDTPEPNLPDDANTANDNQYLQTQNYYTGDKERGNGGRFEIKTYSVIILSIFYDAIYE